MHLSLRPSEVTSTSTGYLRWRCRLMDGCTMVWYHQQNINLKVARNGMMRRITSTQHQEHHQSSQRIICIYSTWKYFVQHFVSRLSVYPHSVVNRSTIFSELIHIPPKHNQQIGYRVCLSQCELFATARSTQIIYPTFMTMTLHKHHTKWWGDDNSRTTLLTLSS